jgi:hypothetical protein
LPRLALVALLLLAASVAAPLHADALNEPRPLVGTRIEGDTKVTEETMLRIGRVALGQPITPAMVNAIYFELGLTDF